MSISEKRGCSQVILGQIFTPKKISYAESEEKRLDLILSYVKKMQSNTYYADLYFIYSPLHDLYKIGSSHTYKKRISNIKYVTGDKRIKLIATQKISHPTQESYIHKTLKRHNADSDLGTEWYLPTDEFKEQAFRIFKINKTMTKNEIKQLAENYINKYILCNRDGFKINRIRFNAADETVSASISVPIAGNQIIRLMAGDWHDAGTYQRV